MRSSAWLASYATYWKRRPNNSININPYDSKNKNVSPENGLMMMSDELNNDQQTSDHVEYFGEVCDIKESPHRLLKTKSLINPIADQAITKLREKIEIKLFSNKFNGKFKDDAFEAAEKGDIDRLEILYVKNPSLLKYKDSKGKSAIHYASSKNRVNIIEFIIAHNGDINAQDENGDTPLHVCVQNDSIESLNYLIQNDANASILNNDMNGAIHVATMLNKVKILEELVKFKGKVDTRLRGIHGRTALHFAAIHDHAECAMILLKELNCCPKIPCNYGYYPIHEAAKNASANTLQAILDWGEKSLGYRPEEMMKCYDAEGNVPLHSAVHAGDIKAVTLCLNSGAVISTQQHDLSTPVHLACSQGAIDIVKLMFESQPHEKINCLSICDAQKFTPLHCAASFDHSELVVYLVNQGANMSDVDKEGRNVLLLAGSRAAWRSVSVLIELGADVSEKDDCNRNILHHIVISGGKLENFTEQIVKRIFERIDVLLNERDVFGCSPMHYASRDGHFKTIQRLLQLGAVINLKNNENQSPLHFAASYGRFNTAKHLLESKKGHLIINEMDGQGMTPLHISSMNGHTRIVRLLLIKGALIHRDYKGRTALHLAAANGHTDTMQQLLLVHSHLLDQLDRDGNTALALAAMHNKHTAATILLSLECKLLTNNEGMSPIDYALHHKHIDVTLAMVMHSTRDEEIMRCKTKKYNCLLEGLTATMPEVMTAILDKEITKSKKNQDNQAFYVKYNFRYLQENETLSTCNNPLPLMNLMVLYDRAELMSHPLCVKYLETKWNSYGMYFHLLNMFVYVVFLIFLTLNAIKLMDIKSDLKQIGLSNVTDFDEWRRIDVMYETTEISNNSSQIVFFTSSVLLVFVILNIVKEFYQMYQQRIKYFVDIINLLEWALYISSGFMSFGFLFGHFHPTTLYITSAISIFMGWFNLLLYMQRFSNSGIYVVMFLEILSTLLKVIFVFSVLIIAFGLSFFILLTKIDSLWIGDKGFGKPSISMIRVGTMMLGEIDFLGTFLRPLQTINDPSNYVKYQMIASIGFLIVFVVLMPILLVNLLIGLAVGDIDTVRRNAHLKRLTMQVQLHTDLERKLPKHLMKLVDKMHVYEYPNRKCKSTSYMWSTLHKLFVPSDAKEQKQQMIEHKHSPSLFQQTEQLRINDDISNQLLHQRKRLSELSKTMEQQLELIRLIIQKMEIQTENDNDYDDRDI